MTNPVLSVSARALLTASAVGTLITIGYATPRQSDTPAFRCGTPTLAELDVGLNFGSPTDCDFSSNSAGASYSPSYVMRIPVVWQVLHQTNGFGDVSDARIDAQMQYLNDSYRAGLGPNGTDSMIEFYLATTDPNGQPTTGIVRTANNNWFNDSGNYTGALSWDTNRYLNIYTLNPFGGGGVIGYVTNLPQGGIVGTQDDAVRMLHSAIDSSNYPHVTAHEIGHHLGLWHTFQDGCPNNDCQTQGDLVCDTNPQSSIDYICGTSATSCGGLAINPNNFMTYQDAPCVWEFTLGQIQRMRCTLEHWRPQLFSLGTPPWTNYCTSTPNSSGGAALMSASGTASIANNNLVLEASPVPNSVGLFFYGPQQDIAPFGNGFRCVQGGLSRMGTHTASNNELSHAVNVNMPSPSGPVFTAGSTWDFQAWFRDIPGGGSQFNLSDGLEVSFVP